MLIHVYLGQRADIDLELAARRQAVRQPVVQAMDAFYDKDLALRKSQLLSGEYALSGDKVIRWHTDFPALEQRIHIVIEIFKVNSFQTLEILFSVLVHREFISRDKIIIHTDIIRF